MGYINSGNQGFGHGCFQTLCDLVIGVFKHFVIWTYPFSSWLFFVALVLLKFKEVM